MNNSRWIGLFPSFYRRVFYFFLVYCWYFFLYTDGIFPSLIKFITLSKLALLIYFNVSSSSACNGCWCTGPTFLSVSWSWGKYFNASHRLKYLWLLAQLWYISYVFAWIFTVSVTAVERLFRYVLISFSYCLMWPCILLMRYCWILIFLFFYFPF